MEAKHTPGPAKHTPGPWRVTDDLSVVAESPATRGTATAHWVEICDPAASAARPASRVDCRDALPAGEEVANARLIAAAPELLAALRSVTALCREYGQGLQFTGAYKAALAALARAEGE